MTADMNIPEANTALNYESLITGVMGTQAASPLPAFSNQLAVAPHFKATAQSAQAYVEGHQQRLKLKIYTIGLKTKERLAKANARLLAKGLATIDFMGMTRKLEAILNDASLTKQQKKDQIEALRKESGLTRKEMRELFTGRFEKIYAAAHKEMESYQKSVIETLKEQLREVESIHGRESPAAATLRAEISEVESVFKPHLEQLESQRSFCKGLYGGRSCIKRTFGAIGGAFKKIGSVLKTVVAWSPIGILGRVPGLRTFIEPFLTTLNKVIDLAARPLHLIKETVEWTRNFFQNPWETLKRGARKVGEIVKKNWTWLVPLALNAIPGVGKVIAPIARRAIRLYKVGKMTYEQGKQIYHHTKEWAVNSWQKLKEAWSGDFPVEQTEPINERPTLR